MNATEFVDQLLKKAELVEAGQTELYPKKQLPLQYDLGLLLATDLNDIDQYEYNTDKEGCLKTLARDNAQLLLNQLWGLPTQVDKVDGIVQAKLPKPLTKLPRAKRVPEPKPLTRWERFAKSKGIPTGKQAKKAKKENLEWDEETKQWVPRYGYKKNKTEKEKNWVVELKETADPFEDPFQKMEEDRKERAAKNEYQRLRNVERAVIEKTGEKRWVPQNTVKRYDYEGVAAAIAMKSTASHGKFEAPVEGQKPPKRMGIRRKFEPNILAPSVEKEKNLKVVEQIMKKKPKLDVEKAVDSLITQEERKKKRNSMRKDGKGKRPKGKHGSFLSKGQKSKKQQRRKGKLDIDKVAPLNQKKRGKKRN